MNLTAFAILALRAAGVAADAPAPHRAGAWLARQQNDDGGFGFPTKGLASDVDDTAAALQALARARRAQRRAAATAPRSSAACRTRTAACPLQRGGSSNAQSTAWAVQGLVAARVPLSGVRRGGSPTPLAYLRSLVGPSGAVRYSRTSTQTPVWVTAYAVLALSRRSLPVRAK